LLFLSARNKRSSIFLKLHTQTLKEKTSNKSTIQTLENRNRALFPYPNATVAATTLTRKPKKQKQSSSILSSTEKTTFRDPSQFPFDTQFQKPAGKAQILQLHSTNHFRFSDKKIMREKNNNRTRHASCDATAEIMQLPVVSFQRRRSVRHSSIIFRS
jgi:hypothetical protein